MFPSEQTSLGRFSEEGIEPAINDALSYPDRIIRAVSAEFLLCVDIPLPEEVANSLDWVNSSPPELLAKCLADQLGKVGKLS